MDDVQPESKAGKDHECLVQRHIRDLVQVGHALKVEDGPNLVLPDLGPREAGDDVDGDDHENTLNWTTEVAKEEDPGVVLLPSCQIEVGKGGDLGSNSPPGATETECTGGEETFEGGVEGVAACRG